MKKIFVLLVCSIIILTSCKKNEASQTLPDLTCSQFFSTTGILPGATIQEVIQISNIGAGPTTAPIVFTVTNYTTSTGLAVISNTNSTVTIGAATYTLTNNADWLITSTTTEITFTSKAGVVIGAGEFKNVGVIISRATAPNQGVDEVVSSSVIIVSGTGGGESPDANNKVTNPITKTGAGSTLPDLTPLQFFSSLQIPVGGTIQEVIQIRNLGGVATSAPIVFTVTTYTTASGLSIASNNSATVAIGPDTYTLSNAADWDFNIAIGSFTSKSGVAIPPGGVKNIGLTISRTGGAPGFLSHTITISAGTGGGETPTTNNTVFNTLIKN